MPATMPRKPIRETFTEPVLLFIEALVANPNVTRAYALAYPTCKRESAARAGHRLSRISKIAAAVSEGRRKRLESYGMDADEAMRRIALIGKADLRELFDEHGKMIPVQDWPDGIALVAKGIEERQYGTKVSFDSRLAALELIAVAGGKLTKVVEVKADLLGLLLAHAKPEDKVPAKPKVSQR